MTARHALECPVAAASGRFGCVRHTHGRRDPPHPPAGLDRLPAPHPVGRIPLTLYYLSLLNTAAVG